MIRQWQEGEKMKRRAGNFLIQFMQLQKCLVKALLQAELEYLNMRFFSDA
jgi:hypothetical protein